MVIRWKQPQLPFPGLRFLPRRKKIVKSNKETFRTGRLSGVVAPLGITQLGQRASRSKIARSRRKVV